MAPRWSDHLLLAPGFVFSTQALVRRKRLTQTRTGSNLGAREGGPQFLLPTRFCQNDLARNYH